MKLQLPGWRAERERATGADGRTDAAVDAAVRIDADLPRRPIQPQTLTFKPELSGIELIDVAGELHHHRAALVRSHLGPQNLGRDVKIDREPIGQWLVHRFARDMQREAALHGVARPSLP